MTLMVRIALLIAVALPFARPAIGQEEPPAPAPATAPADGFAALQQLNALTDENRSALRALVAARVETIVTAADPAAAATAVTELRDRYTGTPAYKEMYAAVTSEAVAGAIKGAKLVGATQLLSVLTTLGDASTYKIFVEALSDERPAIRSAGAAGLRNLRARIAAAGGGPFSETVEALRSAAKKESSAVALKVMYLALNYPEVVPTPPDARALVVAALDILESRSEQYVARKVRAEGADTAGLLLANSLKSVMTEADRDKLVPILGRMLFHAVQQHSDRLGALNDETASPTQIELRNATEQLAEESEALLVELLKPSPAPAVAKKMRDGGKPIDVRLELTRWAQPLEGKTGQTFKLDEVPAAPGGGD